MRRNRPEGARQSSPGQSEAPPWEVYHTSIALRKARAKREKEAKRAAKAEAERRKRREETHEGGSDSGGLFESERLLE